MIDIEDKKTSHLNFSFLYKLISRTTILLFLFLLFTIILYISGNFQDFSDKSQIIIIRTIIINAILLFIFALITLIHCITLLIKTKTKRFIVSILKNILCIIFSVIVYFAFHFLTYFANGI